MDVWSLCGHSQQFSLGQLVEMAKTNQAKTLGAVTLKQEQPSVAEEQLVLVPVKMDKMDLNI